MTIKELKSKKILILGFAREGWSTLKFLRQNLGQAKIGVADKKEINDFEDNYRRILAQDKNLELYLGRNYLASLEKFEMIVKTAGIKLDKKIEQKLKRRKITVTTNLNIFLASIQGQVIGVTGTKGKSTSASLIYLILRAAGKKVFLIGNIGQPFLDYIKYDSRDTIFVAELSSHQLDTLDERKIDVALITSFFPEHLIYHGSLNAYFQAKMNIIRNLKPNGVAVYHKKYSKVGNFIKSIKVRSVGYEGEYKGKTKLIGRQMRENILGCVKAVKLFKIKDEIIEKAVAGFDGLPHRLEYAGKYRGIYWFDDAISTAPESAMAGIKALFEAGYRLTTLIVGGYDRGLDYKNLAREIVKNKIRNVICWPNAGEKIYKEIKKNKAGKEFNLVRVGNMKETIKAAYKYTNPSETVLLSPAASSYDYYKNFEEKGEDFQQEIKTQGWDK